MRNIAGLAFLLLATPAMAQQAPDPAIDEIFARVTGPRTPGCAVGVAENGTTRFVRSYGMANLEHNIPITPETIFEAGSVAKQFTAAAVLLLAEDGRLQLSDDVRKYVPELPDYGAPITIEHLLSHTSGLRDWGSVAALAGWPRGTSSYMMEDVLAIIARQRALNYAPGAEFSYTNSGYNLLATIVQRVSGSTLAEFTKARMFEPLGMRSTSWRDDFRRVVPGRATAYEPRGDSFAIDMPNEDAHGNGGLLTSVQDLLTWNEALTANRLGRRVSERLAERATLNDGRRIGYARGLYAQSFRGEPEISHGGSTSGYRAWLARFPGRRLSVALLCNHAGANPQFGYRVAGQFISEPASAAASTAPGAPVSPDPRLAGIFVNETDGLPLQLKFEEGRLEAVGRGPLQPIAPGNYRSGPAEISFEGADRFAVRMPDGETMRYRRAQVFAPSPAQLASFAGRYQSDEAGAAYILTVENGQLRSRLEERPHVQMELRPVYRDAFEANGGIIRFRRNRSGAITGFGAGISRVRDLTFRRTGPAPAAQPGRGASR
jgi:CubicO group peptidase (beta-lactamase class C family)